VGEFGTSCANIHHMEPKTIKLKNLKPGDGFVGEEERKGERLSRIPQWERVVSVTPCYSGTSTEYVCESGRLYFGPSNSDIEVWR
jgi:hypothetical protein